jgi:hypothetical protein
MCNLDLEKFGVKVVGRVDGEFVVMVEELKEDEKEDESEEEKEFELKKEDRKEMDKDGYRIAPDLDFVGGGQEF